MTVEPIRLSCHTGAACLVCKGSMELRKQAEMHGSAVYKELRPLLFSITYRMVGSVSEAEDIVHEAFLRFHRAQREGVAIESPRAWLSKVVTRLAINHVNSARVRRETYVGTWLPEPLLTDARDDAVHHAETADSLSMAFLVLLETLTPVERAVFLLREVFEYDYEEIAAVVDKTAENCRQIAARARRHIETGKPRFEASRRRSEDLARRFFDAVGEGDTDDLFEMLAEDVVAYGDGGGKAPAFPRPVYGRERVTRLVRGLGAQGERLGVAGFQLTHINGQPGGLFYDRGGCAVLVVSLDVVGEVIQTVRAITNPDKLRHLNAAQPRRSS